MLRMPAYRLLKKQPIRAGGISAPPPQATRRSLSRLRRLLVRAKPNNTASYAGYSKNTFQRVWAAEKSLLSLSAGLARCLG